MRQLARFFLWMVAAMIVVVTIVASLWEDPAFEIEKDRDERSAQLAKSMCAQCHGDALEGRKIPGPGALAGPSLRHTRNWTKEEFGDAVNLGRTPPGRQLIDHIPPAYYRHIYDTEIPLLWTYIRKLYPPDSASWR